jgi:heme/copper-type cytochrome/quinol oxidase subunit 2
MTAPTFATAPPRFAPLRVGVHALVALAIGIVSPFTGMAWPFALLVGMLLGSADARGMRGGRQELADTVASGILAGIGVVAMLIFGAIVGGVIAVAVVVLASFSERAAAHASPTDRGVARILLFVVPVLMWLIVFPLLGVNVDIRIGA